MNQVIRLGLERLRPEGVRTAYESPVFSMGVPHGVNLDKAVALAAESDDEVTLQKTSGMQ